MVGDNVQTAVNTKNHLIVAHEVTNVEHVFGTLKFWMGSAHFLMKTIKHMSTEMSLHVLAYNQRRVINILGVENLRRLIRTGVRGITLLDWHERQEIHVDHIDRESGKLSKIERLIS